MKRELMPAAAALVTAALTVPVAAIAADAVGIYDQALAWVVTAIAASGTAIIAAAVTKVTGAVLDAKARAAVEIALRRAAQLALPWLLDRAADTSMGGKIQDAIGAMLVYAGSGVPGSLGRFKMQPGQPNRQRLVQQAQAALIEEFGKVAPDRLSEALRHAIPPPR